MTAPAPTRRWLRRTGVVAQVAGMLVVGYFVLPSTFGGDTTYVVVKGTSMRPDYVTGDIVAVRPADRYAVGDVVVYATPDDQVGAGKLVMHRIIGTDAEGRFVFRGDNRDQNDAVRLTGPELIGVERVHVPHVALVTRVLLRWWVIGGIVGVITLFVLWPRSATDKVPTPVEPVPFEPRSLEPEPFEPNPFESSPFEEAVAITSNARYPQVSVVVDGTWSGDRQAWVDEVDRVVRRYGATALVVFADAYRSAPPLVGGRSAAVHHGDPHRVVADLAGRATGFVGSRVLLVVTDDAALAQTARRHGAPVVSSASWFGLVGV